MEELEACPNHFDSRVYLLQPGNGRPMIGARRRKEEDLLSSHCLAVTILARPG